MYTNQAIIIHVSVVNNVEVVCDCTIEMKAVVKGIVEIHKEDEFHSRYR